MILIKDLTLHYGNLQTFFSFEPTATFFIFLLLSVSVDEQKKLQLIPIGNTEV